MSNENGKLEIKTIVPNNSRDVWPGARSGHRATASKNRMLVLGGFNPAASPPLLKELWEYNVVKNEWTDLSQAGLDMPDTLASHSVALLKNEYNPNIPHKFLNFGGWLFVVKVVAMLVLCSLFYRYMYHYF